LLMTLTLTDVSLNLVVKTELRRPACWSDADVDNYGPNNSRRFNH
jgi:hypothetical protein